MGHQVSDWTIDIIGNEAELLTEINSNSDKSNSGDINIAISEAIQYCKDLNYDQNPVLILKAMQRKLMKGCPLEIIDPIVCIDGITNIIIVNRDNCLSTGLEEILEVESRFITLEVEFYGEVGLIDQKT